MARRTAAERTVKGLILAAGLGTRLRPLTDATPKCLVEIGGKALLDYWLDSLAAAGIRDVLLNTHHLAEVVRWHIARVNAEGRLRIVEAHEPRLLGSAGTIHANRSWMDGASECLVVYADNLSTVDLAAMLEFHRAHPDPVTMLLFRAPDPRACGIAELDAAGRVVGFVEKPASPKSDLANGGVYVADAAAYREIADLDALDIGFDVLPRFAGRMRGFVFDGYHRDIGSFEALDRARRDVAMLRFPGSLR
jgi:mannose-1-phosphate guanylyltransferase